MNPDEFIAVVDGQIIALELQNDLPEDFLQTLQRQLETVLDTPTLAIGGWEDPTDGPLVLGLDTSGQMVSVISVNPAQADALGNTLASIDEWLSTMTLRSLSELSGNSVEFYEGLLDLSPHSSIILSPRRRFVLLTAMAELDIASVQARLPEADIDLHYVDVLRGPGGQAIIRGRDRNAESSVQRAASTPPIDLDQESDPVVASLVEEPVATEPEVVAPLVLDPDFDELTVEESDAVAEEFSVAAEPVEYLDLRDDEGVIDLNSSIHAPTLSPDLALPVIEPGGTYRLDNLPLLFDATGTTLESISDELFAVNHAIVIVAKLPERRRDTPFEDRRRFRWDTSLERIQLLNEYGYTPGGDLRTVHLFVESDRQPDYAVYIGELVRTAFQTQARIDGETAWFSIAPRLPADLYRLLRKGRLPQFDEGRSIDITAR